MTRIIVSALILCGALAPRAQAQTTSPANPPATAPAAEKADQPKPAGGEVVPPAPTPAALPDRAANPRQDPAPAGNIKANANRRAVPADNRQDPLLSQGRFANPGGVGRRSEYYTAFTPLTTYPGPPVHRAGFGTISGTSRADQVQAFQVGQFRAQNIQGNINAYGRPVGFGFGLGFGRGYGGYR